MSSIPPGTTVAFVFIPQGVRRSHLSALYARRFSSHLASSRSRAFPLVIFSTQEKVPTSHEYDALGELETTTLTPTGARFTCTTTQ